jgi:hypothetical protein
MAAAAVSRLQRHGRASSDRPGAGGDGGGWRRCRRRSGASLCRGSRAPLATEPTKLSTGSLHAPMEPGSEEASARRPRSPRAGKTSRAVGARASPCRRSAPPPCPPSSPSVGFTSPRPVLADGRARPPQPPSLSSSCSRSRTSASPARSSTAFACSSSPPTRWHLSRRRCCPRLPSAAAVLPCLSSSAPPLRIDGGRDEIVGLYARCGGERLIYL